MNATQNFTPSFQITKVACNKKSGMWATPDFANEVWQADKYELIEIKAIVNKFNGKIEFTAANEADASIYSREIAYAKAQGYSYRRANRITRSHQIYTKLGLTI